MVVFAKFGKEIMWVIKPLCLVIQGFNAKFGDQNDFLVPRQNVRVPVDNVAVILHWILQEDSAFGQILANRLAELLWAVYYGIDETLGHSRSQLLIPFPFQVGPLASVPRVHLDEDAVLGQ
jgi:hypothetical protein